MRTPDGCGPLDDVLGPGFVLLALKDVRAALGAARRAFLDDIDTKVVQVLPAGSPPSSHAVVNAENVLLPFLTSFAALIRPDHRVFGTVARLLGCWSWSTTFVPP